MKTVIVILAVLALVYAGDDEYKVKTIEEILEIQDECLKDASLTEEQIAKIKKFEYPDEEAVRKHMLCCATKLGTFSETDGFNTERVTKQFLADEDAEKIADILKDCVDKNEQNSSPDVWLYRGHQCFMEKNAGAKSLEKFKQAQAAHNAH